MAGQTINDRILAARHSIAGQGLAKAVCKATTEEMIGPKKKHLDYLIHCTNEPNVSIPHLATLLIERSQNANWVVVYKSLITTHHLLCYGNERFTQYMASSNSTFQLSNFLDKSGMQGVLSGKTGYDMSPFIRRYSKYLNEKALSYRTVAFDFCKVKRGKDDGKLRTMSAERLLKTLPALQSQLDALLEFDCTANDLINNVINVCFLLLFRDLIRLFACYNDAIINLLENFFDMNKKQCRDALDLYKKFLIRMDRVGEFLKVAENIGIDKGDIPDLTKAPSSLLDALEQHLIYIEGKKTSNSNSQSASNVKNVKSAMNALSYTSTAFGTAATNSQTDALNGFTTEEIDEATRQKVLAEEEAAMNQYKSKVQSPSNNSMASNNIMFNNPFLSPGSSSKSSSPAVDLFAPPPVTTNNKASDDLLQLGNPFAETFMMNQQPVVPSQPVLPLQVAAMQQHNLLQNNVWMNNGLSAQQQTLNINNATAFVSDSNFSSVFGNGDQAGFDAFGNVLQPAFTSSGLTNTVNSKTQSTSGVLTGDLESSLASLAENLSINNRPPPPKEVQWNSPKNGAKPVNWTPQPMAATTGAGYKPMGQGMTTATPVPTLPLSPYQPQIALQGMRPAAIPKIIPTMPTMTIGGYPTQMGLVPQNSTPTGLPTQIQQQHQQSLLFH